MFLKIALVVFIIGFIWYKFFRNPAIKNANDMEETMVACHKCDTYISNKEALIKNGHFYCSKECMHP